MMAKTTDRAGEYKVVQVPFADRATVLQIYSECWSGDPAPAYGFGAKYDWLCGNPAGPPQVLGLRLSNRRWVGMIMLIPRRLLVDGRASLAAFPCEFIIHVDHRTALPALRLVRSLHALAAASGSALYAIPNQRSLPIFQRVGAQAVISRHRWARPLKHAHYLSRHLPSPLTEIAAPVLDAFGTARDRALSLASPNLKAVWVQSFDERFDDLWSRARKARICIGDRGSDFLKWRFSQEPAQDSQILTFVDLGSGRLDGYLVGRKNGELFAIRDLLIALSPLRLAGALSLAMRRIRAIGASSISLPQLSTGQDLRTLVIAGFRARESETVFVTGPAVTQDSEWYLTRADEDV